MPVEIDDRGLRAFIAGLAEEVDLGADETADDVVDLAQQFAPVLTGDFRDSISKEPGEQAGERRVISDGEKAPHNIFVEYGTADSPAQPTLSPAAEAIDPSFRTLKRLRDLAERSAT